MSVDQNERPLVSMNWDGDRVESVSVTNAWRKRASLAELQEAIARQLFDHAFGPVTRSFEDSMSTLDALRFPTTEELLASGEIQARPEPRDSTFSPAALASMIDRLTEIADRIPSPAAQAPTDPAEHEFAVGNVTILHQGGTPLGVRLDESWAERTVAQSLSEQLTEAFGAFADRDTATSSTDDNPDLARIASIEAELADERTHRG